MLSLPNWSRWKQAIRRGPASRILREVRQRRIFPRAASNKRPGGQQAAMLREHNSTFQENRPAAGLGIALRKVRRRLREGPPSVYFWGLLLRRKFTSGGIIVAMPGWPKPRVINRGGEIHVENCAFFPGVRLEVLKGGRIVIGNGTYLNRNTEVIAQQEVRIGRDCMIA